MSKLARMKKQAEVAKEERLGQAKQKIEEAGMGFVDHELPPDEVSEREVRRSLLTSFKTFIPYTNEWYEARAAEDEMDDLRKIRIEKVKAADQYTRTKIGQHEEALDEMMAETNNDFFFFNKLKYKMENEGKWHFEFKKNSAAFSNGNKAAQRNRLRKAINTVYGELDASVTDELARLANAEAAHTKRYDRSAPCNWRGRNKNNEALKCENMRVERPPRSDAPPRKKNEPLDILACCAYHTPFCICDVHELRADVKIKVPNDEAMCAECYMMKRGKKPPPFTATVVPGVVLSSMAKPVEASPKKSRPSDDQDDTKSVGGESVASQASRLRRKVHANKCTWAPNPDNVKARGYECCNEKFVHPINHLKLTTCAWHTPVCLRDHPAGVNPAITIPNPYGLCAQHYLAEKGEPPRPYPFPLPGMQIKLAKDHWKGKRHFAVPKERPPEVIRAKEYEEPEEPQNWMQSLGRMAAQQAYKRRVKKQGKQMATRIQSWFRGCRSRSIHVNIKYLRAKYQRLVSVVRIQALARRRFAVNRVRAKRLKANTAARNIQRTWRGVWCRKQLRIDWAARRITKFFRLTFFFKFKDAVIMIMQIRRLFKRRMMLVIRIQRLFRGYAARWFVYRKRLWNIVSRSCVQKIQRAWRRLLKRRAYVPWHPPGEDWVLRNCAKKLSRMLLEMYLDRNRRAQLAQLMQHSAPEMQRLVRGFLARAGSKKMAFLRHAMRQWVNPRLAGEFMANYLNSRMYFSVQPKALEVILEEKVDNPLFIRKFLPPDKQKRFEIDFRTFEPAIEAYYNSQNMVLLQSERNAILRKFRNPMNGKVQIKPLDMFISAHKLPCRRHGRFICGDCVFRKNCQIGSCSCKLFKSSTSDGHGICITCDHPGSLHSLCPKQMRRSSKANKTSSLLSILTTIREPDMSFPTKVTGVAAEGIIVPAETADDRRVAHTKILAETRRTKRLEELGLTAAGRSLTKSLALCQTCGDSVHASADYWNVHALSALAPIENTADKSDTAIFDPVMHDNHPPDYHIAPATFWNLTSKNPNKTVRDYHEKFDHNMPVPVVKNDEIVYSFEGPQIYFNLVNQIIRLDEKVNFDDPEFLKLVVDHIQLFERHWRKMVADIRTGKLDRRLQINPESRMIFENANIPKPHLAKRLDDTFRKLGFHMKVLGKDINIQPYAKKKKVGIYAEVAPRRKRSLPTNALTSALRPFSADDLVRKAPGARDHVDIGSFAKEQFKTRFLIVEKEETVQPIQPPVSPVRLQRLNSITSPDRLQRRGSNMGQQRRGSSTSPDRLQRRGSVTSPDPLQRRGSVSIPEHSFEAALKAFGGGPAGTRRSMLNSMGASTMTRASISAVNADDNGVGGFRGPSPLKRAATKRELLSALGRSFCATNTEPDARPDPTKSLATSHPASTNLPAHSPSRPVAKDDTGMPMLKRRGSFSDAEAKTITAYDLNAAHYAVETAARDNYRLALKADGDRFVCPFPACGMSFHSKDAAFRHLPVHEQRTRLYAPTPLPDSHLSVYWPSNVPWLTDDRYAKRAIPPGSIVCKVAGCKEVFNDRVHLDLHMRHKHKIVGSSSQSHGYFKLSSNPVYSPPDEPPTYAPIKWCAHHSLPLGSCTTCVEIDAGKGPKQPFRFFNTVTINFRLKRSLKIGLNSFMNADAENGVVSFSSSESTIGVVVMGQPRAEDLLADDTPKVARVGTLRRLNSVSSTGSSKDLRPARRGSVSLMTGSSKQHALDMNSNTNNTNASTAMHEWRGRPVAILVDRNENGWVAVERLLTHQEALQQGLYVPRDFDRRHQLLRPLRAYVRLDPQNRLKLTELDAYDGEAHALFEKYIHWVPIHLIDRTFSLKLVMTQEEVNQEVSSAGHIGLKNKFFVEHGDVDTKL